MTTTETPEFTTPETVCTCRPAAGCDQEGDPGCEHCRRLDSEEPCPADDETYYSLIEDIIDRLHTIYGFEAVVVDVSSNEPFASLDLGHGLVLDITAALRRVDD